MGPADPITTSPERARALVGIAIATGQGAGLKLVVDLERRHGALESWWPEREARLAGSDGGEAWPGACEAVARPDLDARAERMLAKAARAGFRLVEPHAWPRLLTLPAPPALLFQRGDPVTAERVLAVVGARRATAYGLRITDLLVEGVVRRGVAVSSGLARGIDACAHRAALAAGGLTLAVLGCGPDQAYPPEHSGLQEEIGSKGVVLSEYLPGTPPLNWHFPRRNGILVALADAVLVVEGRRRSGTLTSAAWAADLGREVLAVPGPIDSELSQGPIDLMRDGATPVGSVEHILAALGLDPGGLAETASSRPAEALAAPEERMLALLEGGALDLDDLVRISADAPSRVLAMALSLEARGILRREADGRSFRKA